MKIQVLLTIDQEVNEKLKDITSNKSKYVNDLLRFSLNMDTKEKKIQELEKQIEILKAQATNFEELRDLTQDEIGYLSRRSSDNDILEYKHFNDERRFNNREVVTREKYQELVKKVKKIIGDQRAIQKETRD